MASWHSIRYALLVQALGLTALNTAQASDSDDLAELTQPTQRIELGVSSTQSKRSGYGQFYGLGKDKTQAIGQFDLRGGGAYDSEDPRRWRVTGSNLGSNTRNLHAEYGAQGQYRLRFGYDELPYLVSDSYQTPLLGAGSDRLTLPPGFTARTAAGPSALPALGNAFTRFDIGTQRSRYDLGFDAWVGDVWQFKGSFRHELKEGSKARGAVAGSAGGAVMILPEPINTTTDQFGLSLAYAANRQHLQVSYAGSLFRNDIDALRYQNPFSSGQLENRLSTAPDNQFHQIKLDGAYQLGSTTRFSGGIAYGRMSQNQSYLPYSTNPVVSALPQSSLQGLVVTEAVNLKLTSRPLRDWGLLAAYRYDSRDNRTPIQAYTRTNYETGAVYTATNTPSSRARSKATVEADYALRRGSNVTLGLDREQIRRYCGQGVQPCVEVEQSAEHTWRAEWRQTVNQQLSGKLGYARSERKGDSYTALPGVVELSGMAKFLYADRDRSQLRGSLNYLATEALAFNLRVDVNDDQYHQSRFGLTRASSEVFNIDASYTVSEDFNVYAYYSRENIHSRLDSRYSGANQTSLTLPANEWIARMDDQVDAFGLGLRHTGLLSGKLELSADASLIQAVTRYHISGGTCTSSTCNGNLPTTMPNVTSHQLSLRADAIYALRKAHSLRLLAMFNHQRSRDYAYDGISATSSTRILGTNETPVSLNGHFLGLSYLHHFR